jgi:hypothetical protein
VARISIPATIVDKPAKPQPLVDAVGAHLGSVPNFFRIVANSPVALDGFLSLPGGLGKGAVAAANNAAQRAPAAFIDATEIDAMLHPNMNALARFS